MRFRFRIGPFTFGKSGPRLSVWKRGSGISIPLSNKGGDTFGKIKEGRVSAHFGGSKAKRKSDANTSEEEMAITTFRTEERLLQQLRNGGVPWRAVQESLKSGLSDEIPDRNNMAYRLVPRAMDSVFGNQNYAWKTEKRPARRGAGDTTWITLI
ncbi:MAG: hypothetical protein RH862_17260 [Leptospiraceae bacterium]